MKNFKKTSQHELFALIASVCPILLRVSWSSETVPNAPKQEETHQNMSLVSSGMDQERSL